MLQYHINAFYWHDLNKTQMTNPCLSKDTRTLTLEAWQWSVLNLAWIESLASSTMTSAFYKARTISVNKHNVGILTLCPWALLGAKREWHYSERWLSYTRQRQVRQSRWAQIEKIWKPCCSNSVPQPVPHYSRLSQWPKFRHLSTYLEGSVDGETAPRELQGQPWASHNLDLKKSKL